MHFFPVLTPNQHHDDTEDFLSCSVGTYIAKSYGCETGEGEIETCDIHFHLGEVRYGDF